MDDLHFLADLAGRLHDLEPNAEELDAARLRVFDVLVAWRAATGGVDAAVREVSTSLFGTTSAAARLYECAASGRSSEVDDIDLASCTTPGTITVPVVLALAPLAAQRPARDALRAVAAGYEAVTATATALGGPALLTRGVWPSRAVAPIGSAVAAGVLLGLDRDGLVSALALASGVAFDGATREPARPMSFASAVLAGSAAALTAANGGAEGELVSPSWTSRLPAGAVEGAAIRDPARSAVLGSALKPFCGARQCIAAAVALAALAREHDLDPSEIVRVRVALPSAHIKMVDRPTVRSRLDTMASMQYQAALSLLRPDARFDLVRLPVIADASHRALMERVEVVAEASLDVGFPEMWGAEVTVETRSGSVVSRVEGVPGEHDLDWDRTGEKASSLLARAGLSAELGDELRELASGFETVGELSSAFEGLCAPRR